MSPVLSRFDDIQQREGERCAVCRDRLRFPFLDWHGTDIQICGSYCQDIKRGFIADLIQIAAIKDMHDLDDSFKSATLVRRDARQINARFADGADECDC